MKISPDVIVFRVRCSDYISEVSRRVEVDLCKTGNMIEPTINFELRAFGSIVLICLKMEIPFWHQSDVLSWGQKI